MVKETEIQQRIETLKNKKRCQKVGYATNKLAKKAMEIMNLKNKFTKGLKGKMTNSYFCSNCWRWHITSQQKESNRNFKRHLDKLEK